MNSNNDKAWHIITQVELGVPANEVWEVVGGFFNLHQWHPDISTTEVPADQTAMSPLRRILAFPGQPKTIEELILMDNDKFQYRYKWYAGEWGEAVRNYVAEIRLFDLPESKHSSMQWSSTFNHPTDAITEFYQNGFLELQKRFPLE